MIYIYYIYIIYTYICLYIYNIYIYIYTYLYIHGERMSRLTSLAYFDSILSVNIATVSQWARNLLMFLLWCFVCK